MIPVETDEELDELLVALGQPAGAAPITPPDRILAMAAPVAAPVVAVGISKWMLVGAVAASLMAGFVGGALSSRLLPAVSLASFTSSPEDLRGAGGEPPATPPVVTPDPVGEAGAVAALAAGASSTPSDDPVDAASAATGRDPGAAETPVRDWKRSPALATADVVTEGGSAQPGPSSVGETAGSPGSHGAGTPSAEVATVYADPKWGRGPTDPSGVSTASWGTPASRPSLPVDAVAEDERPDPVEFERPRARSRDEEVARVDRTGHGPFALVFDLGGRSFPGFADRPERSLGLQTGVAARFAAREGVVRPALEAGAAFAAPLVPAVVTPAVLPSVTTEVALVLGKVSPTLGWGIEALVPLDARGEPRTVAERIATGPTVGIDIGRTDRTHLRLRMDSSVPVAQFGVALHPSVTVSAGVEMPLGTM